MNLNGTVGFCKIIGSDIDAFFFDIQCISGIACGGCHIVNDMTDVGS